MYCPKCGWNNADDAAKCSNCFTELAPTSQPQPTQQQAPQQPYAQQPYGEQPYGARPVQAVPDYLVWSILVTLFCCLIPGIVAIVKSASANGKRNAGDYIGALQDANAAKTWMWWSFGLGLAGSIMYIIFVIIGVATSTVGQRGF